MDVRELLQSILDELDIKTSDVMVQSEINAIKKQVRESLIAIDDINKNKEEYKRERQKDRFILKLMLPYMVYLHTVLDTFPKDKEFEFSTGFITEILQKHLQGVNNN
jgi:hypothetical protein